LFSFLPKPIRAIFSVSLFAANTIFWCFLIYPFAIARFLLPLKFWSNWMAQIMVWIAETWVSINNFNIELFHKVKWDIQVPPTLSKLSSYLIISNHNSWMDIVILQKVLNRRVPFMRFFLKKELIYVPLLGLAWWALDFPFMKRYSQDFLKKHPEKKGDDMKTTRKACEKFRGRSVSVINFLEGTRFSEVKKKKSESPFQFLLKPKAGGVAFVIGAMGEQFESILDVTIVYPDGVKSLGQTFAGQLERVIVRVRELKIPKDLLEGDYLSDPNFREKVQTWVSGVWREKDELILSLNTNAQI
jgi:1-acyl-sn-glycerol-3-phosphate acyltransferase